MHRMAMHNHAAGKKQGQRRKWSVAAERQEWVRRSPQCIVCVIRDRPDERVEARELVLPELGRHLFNVCNRRSPGRRFHYHARLQTLELGMAQCRSCLRAPSHRTSDLGWADGGSCDDGHRRLRRCHLQPAGWHRRRLGQCWLAYVLLPAKCTMQRHLCWWVRGARGGAPARGW